MGMIKFSGLIIVSIVLILSLVFVGVGLNLNNALYSDFYEDVLDEGGVYEYINENIEATGPGSLVLEGNIEEVVPDLFDSTLTYIRGESEDLELNIDLDNGKIRDLFEKGVVDLRSCNIGEDPFIKGADPCIPPGLDSSQFLDAYLASNDINILDQGSIDLGEEFQLKEDLEPVRSNVESFNSLLYWGKIIIVVCLLLIIFLKFGDSPYGTRWIGVDLAIAGGLLYAIGSVGNALSNLLPLEVIQIGLLTNIFDLIVNSILEGFRSSGVIVFATGVAVLVISFIVSFFVLGEKIGRLFGLSGGKKVKKEVIVREVPVLVKESRKKADKK